MIRRWFINLFREVLAHELLSINALLGEVLMLLHQIRKDQEANQKAIAILEEEAKRLVESAHDGSGTQNEMDAQHAISSTRPSWPRMKRYLEERDARQVIAEQQDSFDSQNAGRIANKFNEEAAKLERYWREKSASVKE